MVQFRENRALLFEGLDSLQILVEFLCLILFYGDFLSRWLVRGPLNDAERALANEALDIVISYFCLV